MIINCGNVVLFLSLSLSKTYRRPAAGLCWMPRGLRHHPGYPATDRSSFRPGVIFPDLKALTVSRVIMTMESIPLRGGRGVRGEGGGIEASPFAPLMSGRGAMSKSVHCRYLPWLTMVKREG